MYQKVYKFKENDFICQHLEIDNNKVTNIHNKYAL